MRNCWWKPCGKEHGLEGWGSTLTYLKLVVVRSALKGKETEGGGLIMELYSPLSVETIFHGRLLEFLKSYSDEQLHSLSHPLMRRLTTRLNWTSGMRGQVVFCHGGRRWAPALHVLSIKLPFTWWLFSWLRLYCGRTAGSSTIVVICVWCQSQSKKIDFSFKKWIIG